LYVEPILRKKKARWQNSYKIFISCTLAIGGLPPFIVIFSLSETCSSLGNFIKERSYFRRITFIVTLLCNSIFSFF
jgi:hypothetical protein